MAAVMELRKKASGGIPQQFLDTANRIITRMFPPGKQEAAMTLTRQIAKIAGEQSAIYQLQAAKGDLKSLFQRYRVRVKWTKERHRESKLDEPLVESLAQLLGQGRTAGQPRKETTARPRKKIVGPPSSSEYSRRVARPRETDFCNPYFRELIGLDEQPSEIKLEDMAEKVDQLLATTKYKKRYKTQGERDVAKRQAVNALARNCDNDEAQRRIITILLEAKGLADLNFRLNELGLAK